MLTAKQEELADLLINTKTHAKVRRRKQKNDGSYEFFYVIRDTSPVDFREDPSEFAFVHHEKDPTAPLSPIIINLRNLPENLVKSIAGCMAHERLSQIPDVCTGIPNAALPYAKEFAKISNIPYVDIFEKDDKPGSPRILPAQNPPAGKGKTLLIIDDVITKGESKFRAFKVAEELGYKVLGLIVLVDRDEGGKEIIEKAGYEFYAPLQLKDLLDYYLEKGKIDQKLYDKTVEYLNASKKRQAV